VDDSPPLKAAGRATILATAIGEESFTDTNGNGYWDAGEPFVNLGEPYRDDNENGVYDVGEYFLDFNQNQVRDAGDGTFKGITCTGNTPGSTCSTTTLAIGVSHLLIMSTAAANIAVTGTPGFGGASPLTLAHTAAAPAAPSTGTIDFNVQDLNGNPMPAGTTVKVTADTAIGTISGPGASWTIGCRTALGGESLVVTLTAAANPASGNITITVTSPGTKTATVFTIAVQLT
jgi:hypothetical protein